MIEQRGVVSFLWAKNMDAAKDIHKEMLPIWANNKYPFLLLVGSLIILTYPTHPTVHKRCKLAAKLANGGCLLDKIGPYTFKQTLVFHSCGSCRVNFRFNFS
jgi:hypothetical protein